MKEWRLHFPIKVMSRLFKVSRSGFYAWCERPPSHRAQEDERLKVAIKAAHKITRESYSARRLQPELAADVFVAGRDRISRLRRELGIRCRQKRKFKTTTNSNHNLPVAENLLNQNFAPSVPNEVWVTDITYIPTGSLPERDGCTLQA
jgi:transposase InsO family protein